MENLKIGDTILLNNGLVIFEVTDINLAGASGSLSIYVQYSYCNVSNARIVKVNSNGIYKGTFTTGATAESSNKYFRLKGTSEQWENDVTTTERTLTFKNVIVLEGDYTNRYIPPYFEGIIGVGDKSKNLFNPNNLKRTVLDLGKKGEECIEKNSNTRCRWSRTCYCRCCRSRRK